MRSIRTLLTILSLTALPVFAQPVHIPDSNLRAAVRDTLGLPDGTPITRDVMLQLTKLDVTGHGIADLTGLEFATNLTRLKIGRNPIIDLSPIAGLIRLGSLYMWATPVSDITPVAHLTNLNDFRASYCEITDISPLANLVKLEKLSLPGNAITDITSLANLTQLRLLNLENNSIADVRPLAGLPLLKALTIERNRITDHSPLDGLSLDHFTHDLETPCDMAPLPLAPRIENRNFPSLFAAWIDNAKYPAYDLIFCCPRFAARLRQIGDGFQFRTDHASWDGPAGIRDTYLEQNPTMVFLHGLAVIWGDTAAIPEDSPWWQRDDNGDILYRRGTTRRGLMDLNHPGWQQRMIDIAVTIDQCGLYDGIFIDGWGDGGHPGQTVILKGIRERVRDNFLIMVNTNDNQAPASAPYINGLFMETGFPEGGTIPEDIERGLVKVENTLRWAEETLLEPRIIGLEGSDYRHESPHTPRNMRWMRATTTLGLTFSDGYVAFPLRGGPWYDFWNADLGRPVGEKGQLYQETEGLYIREYTNGWAVYNHSGAAQIVTLPEEVQSVASGLSNAKHAVLNLDGDIYLRVTVRNPADINQDGVVNILDLTLVAQGFGSNEAGADVNGDGVVNVFDLVFVANAF